MKITDGLPITIKSLHNPSNSCTTVIIVILEKVEIKLHFSFMEFLIDFYFSFDYLFNCFHCLLIEDLFLFIIDLDFQYKYSPPIYFTLLQYIDIILELSLFIFAIQ